MDITRAAQALAEASSSLTKAHDVTDALIALLESCKAGLDVEVGGILVAAPSGTLELLAASSHRAAELEVHQLHVDEGPCVDAYRAGTAVQVHSSGPLVERWPAFGPTMLRAGLLAVHAAPLVWRGETFGAMGLFRQSDEAFTVEEDQMAQAFADIATMLVLHIDEVDASVLRDRLTAALSERVELERAKGVLAETHGVDMGEAYELLRRGAVERGTPLGAWASQVVADAQHPRS